MCVLLILSTECENYKVNRNNGCYAWHTLNMTVSSRLTVTELCAQGNKPGTPLACLSQPLIRTWEPGGRRWEKSHYSSDPIGQEMCWLFQSSQLVEADILISPCPCENRGSERRSKFLKATGLVGDSNQPGHLLSWDSLTAEPPHPPLRSDQGSACLDFGLFQGSTTKVPESVGRCLENCIVACE